MLKLPAMGESVTEATLTAWLKEVGDTIEMDDAVLEVATDKVDSDVPSDVSGTLVEKRFNVNDVIQVGDVIAVIESEAINDAVEEPIPVVETIPEEEKEVTLPPEIIDIVEAPVAATKQVTPPLQSSAEATRFYSPLVRNIAATEGVSSQELEAISGTGDAGRVTKKDILAYLKERDVAISTPKENVTSPSKSTVEMTPPAIVSGEDQIIEMSRMGKLISNHMTESKNTSVHVQSYVEADVTELWDWREKTKGQFQAREGEKLTFTPIFISAIIHALKEFPLLNSSVNGDQIIQKRNINIGMATALGDGNLIVPVIKKADHLNLVGLAKAVNDLSNRARLNQLQPEEVQDGTYTVTNIGNFGSITGTPIINQPQVGIIALGVIRKMPAVIETADGDFVGIRRKMILSHSYDHRIINGAMGGQFVKAVADYLEQWDTSITF